MVLVAPVGLCSLFFLPLDSFFLLVGSFDHGWGLRLLRWSHPYDLLHYGQSYRQRVI
ncbi:hypothetical protein BO94DRAFT_534918 [Aspergillus sclerotioniger CBS 115572]|uniref:Uncharacterized protein n=1 Tax=Aspergillus sclerotioniger CBS 115572 TaxID=1450535 RepID=A0A317WS13_9EURO|nr:hypothetical protein BO94DRAFT_534918 [Aspergillus sclerotioniger CBS 115572]PWY87917.1 hypothetical protein BO94DRAFT_534918 [Aspergillus sclerotioniger CBS 115572]